MSAGFDGSIEPGCEGNRRLQHSLADMVESKTFSSAMLPDILVLLFDTVVIDDLFSAPQRPLISKDEARDFQCERRQRATPPTARMA